MYRGAAGRLGSVIGAGMLAVVSAAIIGKAASVRRRISELEREAHTDHLTGLRNRRASEKRLQADLLRARRETDRMPERGSPGRSLMLVTADLDGLKQVNDIYGHEAGDRYLQAFARILNENLRTEDWAGRLGGDEFVIALWEEGSDETHDETEVVIGRLLELTRNTVVELPGGHSTTLSASFGAARYGDCFADYRRLSIYEQADMALLQAKREGKGRVVYA